MFNNLASYFYAEEYRKWRKERSSLIDKLKQPNKDQWEPEPLWIEDYTPIPPEDPDDKDNNDKDNVIVIDL